MIQVTVYENSFRQYCGFHVSGHAGFAAYGSDIVCAAVSALVINTINSIEAFAKEDFGDAVHQEQDEMDFCLPSEPVGHEAELLLKSLVLGLQAIEEEYGKQYIRLKIKRKQEV